MDDELEVQYEGKVVGWIAQGGYGWMFCLPHEKYGRTFWMPFFGACGGVKNADQARACVIEFVRRSK